MENQRGFSLLEVLIATALTMCVLLASAAAVGRALRGAALSDEQMALRDDALSVLTDVRTLTAYNDATDPAKTRLHALVGHTAGMTLSHAGGPDERVTVTISQSGPTAKPVAEATVTAAGISVSERMTLSVEAPAPGSAVAQ